MIASSNQDLVEEVNADADRNQCVEITQADFDAEVLRSQQPVVVEFWAPWSHPCKILDATLNEAATRCRGSAKVVKVNADDNPELSLWYDVQSVPTLLYFVGGELRARLVGTASTQAILAKLQSLCPFRAPDRSQRT
jgi:thioredoxin 1